MAKTLLGLERVPAPMHAADALAVAFCHVSAPALLRLAGSPVLAFVRRHWPRVLVESRRSAGREPQADSPDTLA